MGSTCPKCRGRVRGGICDGCGALVLPRACDHQPGPTKRGVIMSRDGLARGAWVAYCRLCSRVLEVPAPVVVAGEVPGVQ